MTDQPDYEKLTTASNRAGKIMPEIAAARKKVAALEAELFECHAVIETETGKMRRLIYPPDGTYTEDDLAEVKCLAEGVRD